MTLHPFQHFASPSLATLGSLGLRPWNMMVEIGLHGKRAPIGMAMTEKQDQMYGQCHLCPSIVGWDLSTDKWFVQHRCQPAFLPSPTLKKD